MPAEITMQDSKRISSQYSIGIDSVSATQMIVNMIGLKKLHFYWGESQQISQCLVQWKLKLR